MQIANKNNIERIQSRHIEVGMQKWLEHICIYRDVLRAWRLLASRIIVLNWLAHRSKFLEVSYRKVATVSI